MKGGGGAGLLVLCRHAAGGVAHGGIGGVYGVRGRGGWRWWWLLFGLVVVVVVIEGHWRRHRWLSTCDRYRSVPSPPGYSPIGTGEHRQGRFCNGDLRFERW